MAVDSNLSSATALEESPEAAPAHTEFESLDTAGLDMAIAEIELQERGGLAGGTALALPELTESAELHRGEPAHPAYDLDYLLDEIARRRGLKDSAAVTPDYLAIVSEEGRIAEIARRESLGLKTMTREDFSAELAEAYAAIDEYARSA